MAPGVNEFDTLHERFCRLSFLHMDILNAVLVTRKKLKGKLELSLCNENSLRFMDLILTLLLMQTALVMRLVPHEEDSFTWKEF